jgi:hypothetical protein
MLDNAQNVELFKNWAKEAEGCQFVTDSFEATTAAANTGTYAGAERVRIRMEAQVAQKNLAHMRTEVYNFAVNVYTKSKFGNIAESIFEKRRRRVEPVLQEIFPDINQRLNSIEQNISSDNPEDWKNAVTSCRTLLSDIADVLNPAQTPEDKGKYINRLKDFISPRVTSDTKSHLLKTYFDELKNRVEYTLNLTQGGSHQQRPSQEEAEDVVLHTYLLIADLMIIYKEKNPN